jgi:hypothetical protein
MGRFWGPLAGHQGRLRNLQDPIGEAVQADVPRVRVLRIKSPYMTSAAFLTPLSPGIHTVVIRGNANGDDTVEVFTALGITVPFPFSITYTVTVH